MRGFRSKIQHLPYFEALSVMEENTPEWRCTSAGLVALRLFDRWVTDDASAVAADLWTTRAVRDAIAEIQLWNPIRAVLTSMVDAMERSLEIRMAVIAPRLMAYGRSLEFDAKWPLAADVYRTVLSHAHPVDDAEIVVSANMRLGACLRLLAEWEEAEEAYVTAGEVAELAGDVMNVLRSRIAEANVAMDRGNLPEAESILDETLDQATGPELAEVRALALQDRAHVAHLRGDYELSIRMAYEALSGLKGSTARDRALAGLAASFSELGVRSAARDANLILAATAQEQYVRWAATLNLLEIAGLDQMEPAFEQYRRELSQAALPPMMAAHYHYYLAQGYRLFGKTDLAITELERAVEISAAHQINQILIKAESTLLEVNAGKKIKGNAALEVPPPMAHVAAAVRDMRVAAGVTG
ncbi:MAG: hypothetical protein H7Z74_12725 [Anaerolineae bacterium]|nr:hypothetical protein [Gemmatimonadaceae bacterium]